MRFFRPKLVTVSAGNMLSFVLPESFRNEGPILEDMEVGIYRFTVVKIDWGGYSQFPVVMHVTVMNPDLARSEYGRLRSHASRLLAGKVLRGDVAWQESAGGLRLGKTQYKWNTTEKPAWVVQLDGEGFAVDFYAWTNRYSAKGVKKLAAQAAASLQLKNLREHWLEVADRPRREREAKEAKLDRIKASLAAAGFPPPEPSGKIYKHDGFLYAISADRDFFGIAFELGELVSSVKPQTGPRAEFVISPEDQEQTPNVWYFPDGGEWKVRDHNMSWWPTKELLEYLEATFTDEDAVHFYAAEGFSLGFRDLGDFQVAQFAERARRLKELFLEDKVARLRR